MQAYHWRSNTWLERRLDLFVQELPEVDVLFEEGMLLNLFSAIGT